MVRENRRHTATSKGNVYFTETEEVERDNKIAAFEAGANDRAAEAAREKRNILLASTDYLALSDTTLSSDMNTYRQALRDITAHSNWPNLANSDWPTKP